MIFELQPVLTGERLQLRPLVPTDWDALYAVASDPLIWEQHPVSDRWREESFRTFFDEALESGGALVAIDRSNGAVIGSSRFYGFDPARSEVEIGWTFLARDRWGGEWNGEMKRLMLDHAFRFADSVLFLIGPGNIRSQRAVGKIGAVLDGHTERFGRDSLVFRLRAADWAGRAAAE
jgi:RimJ/RimL family protein N-acetyltransferase